MLHSMQLQWKTEWKMENQPIIGTQPKLEFLTFYAAYAPIHFIIYSLKLSPLSLRFYEMILFIALGDMYTKFI